MQVSCKVSYSVLVYLERQGAQMERFFEKFETPVEFFKDPSGWIEVAEMENFLVAVSEFLDVKNPHNFYREIGQQNFELRAWGVLDSVLKMVESPNDIFTQPDRFLSYFLTPHPELVVEKVTGNKLTFKMSRQPSAGNIMAYLIGAVEGLPNYMGRPTAQIQQMGALDYQITWFDDQESLFDEQEKKRRQFHPEIVHSVMQSFQEQQDFAGEAFEKMVSLEVEKRLNTWMNKQQEFDESLFKIKNDFYKMYDYFTRAQQIITLISPSARKASVREAMRRVDWEHIQKEFPKMVESACDSILTMKDTFHTTVEENSVPAKVESSFQPTNLNELIETVVESLDSKEKALKVDRNLHLDKNVNLDAQSFALALGDVFQSSIASASKEAEVKIVTRSSGSKIQIEITDSGSGFSDETLQTLFQSDSSISLKKSQEIIQRHRGNISVSSRQGEGATYLIEIPG